MDSTQFKKKLGRVGLILDIVRDMIGNQPIIVRNHIDRFHIYLGFANGPDELVACGDWNNVDIYNHKTKERETVSIIPSRLRAIFERMGIQCVFDDVHRPCCECDRLLEISPDGLGWKPQFIETKDGLLCFKCRDENEDS
jgi:hypothetical protein